MRGRVTERPGLPAVAAGRRLRPPPVDCCTGSPLQELLQATGLGDKIVWQAAMRPGGPFRSVGLDSATRKEWNHERNEDEAQLDVAYDPGCNCNGRRLQFRFEL